MSELWEYATTRMSDGRVSGLAEIYLQGKGAMIRDIKADPLISSTNPFIGTTNKKVRDERLRDTLDAYTDAKNRIERWNVIAQKKSAAYWIDNRTDNLPNHLNKKLKKYIDGK